MKIVDKKKQMEEDGTQENLITTVLNDLWKFFSLYYWFVKTSDSKICAMNISISINYIELCMVDQFLSYGIDKYYQNYLGLSNDKFLNLRNWTQTRLDILKTINNYDLLKPTA